MNTSVEHPHLAFLRRQEWFGKLGSTTQRRLDAVVRVVHGCKGQVIFNSGTSICGWYGIVDGLVKLQSHTQLGETSAFIGIPSGQWFGEGSLLKRELRRYDVVALSDTTLLCLPVAEFHLLFSTSIDFAHAVTHQLNVRLGQAMALIEADRARTPEQRICVCLGNLLWQGTHTLEVTQEELGKLAGLSRQTVNRCLQVLEKRRLLSLQFGKIVILDRTSLSPFSATS